MDQTVAPPAPRAAGVTYSGTFRAVAALFIKGWLLTIVTLGIYRFWLITNARRYLWSHTDVAGDQLEYTGRGGELLIGFLMALAIFVPLNLLVSFAALGGNEAQGIATLVYLAVLALLVPFALYRGRRYRLNRTVHRGVRLGMGGSGMLYALRWIGWALLTLVTFGFAYPWMHASLERYAIGNTYYGDKRAFFSATGTGLWKAILILQFVVMGPFIAGIIAFAKSTEAGLLFAGDMEGFVAAIEAGDMASGFAALMFGFSWVVPVAFLLYPAYRAIELRWWASGISLDELTMQSRLRAGQVYMIYLKFWGAMLLAGIGIAIVMTLLSLLVFGALDLPDVEALAEGRASMIATLATLAVYLAFAITYAVLYYTMLWAGYWKVASSSFQLINPSVLERASRSPHTSGALGEGIADALDIGGF